MVHLWGEATESDHTGPEVTPQLKWRGGGWRDRRIQRHSQCWCWHELQRTKAQIVVSVKPDEVRPKDTLYHIHALWKDTKHLRALKRSKHAKAVAHAKPTEPASYDGKGVCRKKALVHLSALSVLLALKHNAVCTVVPEPLRWPSSAKARCATCC